LPDTHPQRRLQLNRPLEGFIGKLETRCKYGPEEGRGVDQECDWQGRVSDLSAHLAESCAIEPVKCPNAAAGCNESVMRKDAALHAFQTCGVRLVLCAHCHSPFEARALLGHEGNCPEARVECPFPGCNEWMMRAEVKQHETSSGAVHLQRALTVLAEMGNMVGLQKKKAGVLRSVIEEQTDEITGLRGDLHLRLAICGVFSWETDSEWSEEDSEWSEGDSESFTFREEGAGGGGRVRGSCHSKLNRLDETSFTHFMGFILLEGPVCDMHIK